MKSGAPIDIAETWCVPSDFMREIATVWVRHPSDADSVARAVKVVLPDLRCGGHIHAAVMRLIRIRLLTEVIVHILHLIQIILDTNQFRI